MVDPRVRRRQKTKDEIKDASDRTDNALANVNGNPKMIEAIEALRDEIDAIEEFLSIEVNE